MKKITLVLFTLLICIQAKPTDTLNTIVKNIIITAKVSGTDKNTSITLRYAPANYVGPRTDWEEIKTTALDGMVKWELPGDQCLLVNIPWDSGHGNFYLEPGDSIQIHQSAKTLHFTGNTKAKFDLFQAVRNIPGTLKKPTNYRHTEMLSPEGFREWDEYLNAHKEKIDHLLEQYRPKVSPNACQYLKAREIARIESIRISKFTTLFTYYRTNKKDRQELIDQYDKCILNKETQWLNNLQQAFQIAGYYYAYAKLHQKRMNSFSYDLPDFDNKFHKAVELIKHGEGIFKGVPWYEFQTMVVAEDVIRKYLYVEGVPSFVESYYKQNIPEAYKIYAKKFEHIKRDRSIGMGEAMLSRPYHLGNGMVLDKNTYKGKILLLNFLKAGDPGSQQAISAIQDITTSFKQIPAVSVINILVEQEELQKANGNIPEAFRQIGPYLQPPTASILYDLNVKKFPTCYVIGTDGYIIPPAITLQKDSGVLAVSDVISRQVAEMNDGPYLNIEKDSVSISLVRSGTPERKYHPLKENLVIRSNTDRHNKLLDVRIRLTDTSAAPCIYNDQGKILAVSDIEGNFTAFRKLLQANGVIDDAYNWTFGSGHLVLLGDFFDRGRQVTECLWLIYLLEQKAYEAGGYVHFILGNHEVMNLSGDIRYVDPKYQESAKALKVAYEKFYGSTSILGQWLRNKNIIEKINGILFVHGGISNNVLLLGKSLPEINALTRNALKTPKGHVKENDSIAGDLLFTKASPCWYRGYYTSDPAYKAPEQVVNNTLTRFGANRIITGHTLTSSIITAHYNGKIINIDTRHSLGHSEALLFENGEYFRMNFSGQKLPLALHQ